MFNWYGHAQDGDLCVDIWPSFRLLFLKTRTFVKTVTVSAHRILLKRTKNNEYLDLKKKKKAIYCVRVERYYTTNMDIRLYIFSFFFSLLHTDLSFLSSSNLVFFVLFLSLINEWV